MSIFKILFLKVYSHYLDLTSGSNAKIEVISNSSHNKKESEEIDSSVLTMKSQKKKSRMSDIECDSMPSVAQKMEQKQSNRSLNTDSDKCDQKNIKPFNYSDYDYSTFSSNNNTGKPSFDPQTRAKQNFRPKVLNFFCNSNELIFISFILILGKV
jgi:hypothetical protein